MSRRIPDYDRSNRLAATIILADPKRFGGPDGLMVRHSRMVLARLGQPVLVNHLERPASAPGAAPAQLALGLVEEEAA
jgi:hypothetical protein